MEGSPAVLEAVTASADATLHVFVPHVDETLELALGSIISILSSLGFAAAIVPCPDVASFVAERGGVTLRAFGELPPVLMSAAAAALASTGDREGGDDSVDLAGIFDALAPLLEPSPRLPDPLSSSRARAAEALTNLASSGAMDALLHAAAPASWVDDLATQVEARSDKPKHA